MYPLKVGKRAAHNKWVTLATKGELPDLNDLLEAVNRYKQSDKVKQGFICHPATWLHQGRWADELEVPDQSKVAPACETCGVLLGGLTMCPLLDRACPQGLPS